MLKFEFGVPPAEAAIALSQVVNDSEQAEGVVTSTKVKLKGKSVWWWHNSFNPIFVGRFESSAEGSVLRGRFRMSWPVIAFIAFFIGMSVSNMLETLAAPASRDGYVEGWRDQRLESDYAFVGAGIVIPIVGWVLGAPVRRRIVETIVASEVRLKGS